MAHTKLFLWKPTFVWIDENRTKKRLFWLRFAYAANGNIFSTEHLAYLNSDAYIFGI